MRAGGHSTFVISLTPFTDDGDLDEPGLRAHLRRLGAAGIGVYLAGSGSGEGYTLTRAERRRVLRRRRRGARRAAYPCGRWGWSRARPRRSWCWPRTRSHAGLDATQVYSLDLGHGYVPTADEQRTYLRTVLDHAPGDLVLSTHQSVGYHYDPRCSTELARPSTPASSA